VRSRACHSAPYRAYSQEAYDVAEPLAVFLEANGMSVPEWLRPLIEENPDLPYEVLFPPAKALAATGGTSVLPDQAENGALLVWVKPQGDGQWIGKVPGLEGIEELFAVTDPDLASVQALRCRAGSRRLLEQYWQERYSS
jgi:hypothetical protein